MTPLPPIGSYGHHISSPLIGRVISATPCGYSSGHVIIEYGDGRTRFMDLRYFCAVDMAQIDALRRQVNHTAALRRQAFRVYTGGRSGEVRHV